MLEFLFIQLDTIMLPAESWNQEGRSLRREVKEHLGRERQGGYLGDCQTAIVATCQSALIASSAWLDCSTSMSGQCDCYFVDGLRCEKGVELHLCWGLDSFNYWLIACLSILSSVALVMAILTFVC